MTQATTKLKVFLDSSALISAVITPNEGSAIYRIVMLGEANVLDLRISREVVGDVERFVNEFNPDMRPKVAEVIARGNMAVTPAPSEETITFCEKLTGHRPDARILAASVECDADVLATHDSTHLRGNPKIKPPGVTVLVLNPKECLEWCFAQWKARRQT